MEPELMSQLVAFIQVVFIDLTFSGDQKGALLARSRQDRAP